MMGLDRTDAAGNGAAAPQRLGLVGRKAQPTTHWLLFATSLWLLCVVLVTIGFAFADAEWWLWVLLAPIAVSIAGVFVVPRLAAQAAIEAQGASPASRSAVGFSEVLLGVLGVPWLFLLGWLAGMVVAFAPEGVFGATWSDAVFLLSIWLLSAAAIGGAVGHFSYRRLRTQIPPQRTPGRATMPDVVR